jgi:hypothetical protein
MRFKNSKLLVALSLVLSSNALAATTWYVNGVTGSDTNNCLSPTAACKTIGHAISLALSGDSIMVAAATYTEHLAIKFSLTIVGSGATTIIDGGGVARVLKVSNANAHVTLASLTIQNGLTLYGGGIYNVGTLTLNSGTVTQNQAKVKYRGRASSRGGGIYNSGILTINNSTISSNFAQGFAGFVAQGGGIYNAGTLTLNNSTLSGNSASVFPGQYHECVVPNGGGIYSQSEAVTINNSTLSGNSAHNCHGYGVGGGIYGNVTLQNTIVANSAGGNCSGTMTSDGYNLSSDGTCQFNGPGDLNSTDPKLGPLQNNGGPTQTMALSSGSPAIDAGNPNGCNDGSGHLLKTDQRGMPRPDPEDTGGCDIGAYESQSD